jgi:hypothetical protein
MTFGVLGILIAVAAELGMLTHWLWFARGFLAPTRRKPHLSHVKIVTHAILMFAGSAAIAGALYAVLVPVEAQPVPVGLIPYIAPALTLWLLGCGYLCCAAIVGAIKNERPA